MFANGTARRTSKPSERTYTTKSRNAQEAHEAIRPAGTEMHTAEELSLSGREAELYAMIWKRTVASQMVDAQLLFQTVTISSGDAEFRATGRHIEFPGYFRAYVEGVDDPEAAMDDQESALPPLSDRIAHCLSAARGRFARNQASGPIHRREPRPHAGS